MIHQARKRFLGLFPATFTAFTKEKSVNLEAIEQYARVLADEKLVQGAFINGTSGESMTLSCAERKAIAEKWVSSFKKHNPELRPIIHIGTPCLEDAKEMAAHVKTIGAAGFAAMAPLFFKPKNEEALVDYLSIIASQAPDTPFLYYHYPEMTGVNIPVHKVLKLGQKKIPNLVGAKYTGFDLNDVSRCLALEDGKFDILFGYDVGIYSVAAIGCRAGIGISYSLCGELYKEVFDLINNEEKKEMNLTAEQVIAKCKQLQRKSVRLFEMTEKHGDLIPVFKEMMKIHKGIDFGGVRSPIQDLTEEQKKGLREDFKLWLASE